MKKMTAIACLCTLIVTAATAAFAGGAQPTSVAPGAGAVGMVPVPEPSGIIALISGIGGVGLAAKMWRRR